MSNVPLDPTKPKDPLLVARPRPDSVTMAGTFMIGGSIMGLLNAILVIGTAGTSAREFRTQASLTTATAKQIDDVATGLATWAMTAGLTGLLLSLLTAVLAVRVWRGSYSAKIAALAFVSASLLCGLGWSAFTVRGDANLRPDGMDEQTGRGISEALGVSTSGLPTYVGGGLTCLQVLADIGVLGFLLWPSSGPYFRRSRPAAAGGDATAGSSTAGNTAGNRAGGNTTTRPYGQNGSDEPDASQSMR